MHVCSCNYGVEAHGTECPINNEPKCMSCNPGLILDANNTCVCDTGFYMNENGTCSSNQCICPDVHGIPATGVECPENGATKCEGCEDGFRLVNELCEENTCFCNNGIAATGDKCTENDAEICTECTSGFTLIGNACVKMYVFVTMAKLLTALITIGHEMHKCASCAMGIICGLRKTIDIMAQFLKECDCDNGEVQKVPRPTVAGYNCVSCHEGWTKKAKEID